MFFFLKKNLIIGININNRYLLVYRTSLDFLEILKKKNLLETKKKMSQDTLEKKLKFLSKKIITYRRLFYLLKSKSNKGSKGERFFFPINKNLKCVT